MDLAEKCMRLVEAWSGLVQIIRAESALRSWRGNLACLGAGFENLAEKHPNLAEKLLSLVEKPEDLAERATRGACSAWALWLLPRPRAHRNMKISFASEHTDTRRKTFGSC